jgi:hypothetical protein
LKRENGSAEAQPRKAKIISTLSLRCDTFHGHQKGKKVSIAGEFGERGRRGIYIYIEREKVQKELYEAENFNFFLYGTQP